MHVFTEIHIIWSQQLWECNFKGCSFQLINYENVQKSVLPVKGIVQGEIFYIILVLECGHYREHPFGMSNIGLDSMVPIC